jgi:hypothetical protein
MKVREHGWMLRFVCESPYAGCRRSDCRPLESVFAPMEFQVPKRKSTLFDSEKSLNRAISLDLREPASHKRQRIQSEA